MEDSGGILIQISSLKDMLDEVNKEIESNIQITREIESEIVQCDEFEIELAARESELTKALFLSHFQINGLLSVAAQSKNSVEALEEELRQLETKRGELLRRTKEKREGFIKLCLEFQSEISREENNDLENLLTEKETLENEAQLLDKKINTLRSSMLAFMEDILEEFDHP